ncbi:MAG: M28 family metallopeptidase [Gammaproteobacteria bacterium]|nr:M28 family metallopeptidase [Gammaproteobacteria bacterium]
MKPACWLFLTLALPPLAWAAPEAVPPQEHPALREIAGAVSAEHLRSLDEKLVGFHTRHTLSSTTSPTRGIGAARRWVKAQFEGISKNCGGCLQVITPSQVVTGPGIPEPTEVMDVVAIQKGTTDPSRYIVMTAHLDSRVADIMNSTANAPGADDDGSGVSAVLETARVLSKYKFNATIVYSADSGEEQGLYGGKIIARHAKAHGWNVEADINNDMIGNSQGSDGVMDNIQVRVFSEGISPNVTPAEIKYLYYHGGEVDSPARQLARYMAVLCQQYVPDLKVMLMYRDDRFGRGGDQMEFDALGYPAVRVTEAHENFTRQHNDVKMIDGVQHGDLLSGVDFTYARKITALDAITLASLAWAPAPPSGVEITGAVTPNTTVSWKPIPGAAGYRVYWRDTTAPLWTHSEYVGDVTRHELRDISIDNYFFGVASVSQDGFESPVVFPGPGGVF